jgi:hypothetical protein
MVLWAPSPDTVPGARFPAGLLSSMVPYAVGATISSGNSVTEPWSNPRRSPAEPGGLPLTLESDRWELGYGAGEVGAVRVVHGVRAELAAATCVITQVALAIPAVPAGHAVQLWLGAGPGTACATRSTGEPTPTLKIPLSSCSNSTRPGSRSGRTWCRRPGAIRRACGSNARPPLGSSWHSKLARERWQATRNGSSVCALPSPTASASGAVPTATSACSECLRPVGRARSPWSSCALQPARQLAAPIDPPGMPPRQLAARIDHVHMVK